MTPRRPRTNERAKNQAYKAANNAIGRCKSCPRPVATKKCGVPAKLCERHLELDHDRIVRREARSPVLPFSALVRVSAVKFAWSPTRARRAA